MPASFWIFLIICIASFVVVIEDHGEAWDEFKDSNGGRKWWKGIKIFTLWFIAFGSLIGTLVLGRESWQDSKKDAEREEQFKNVTNQLAKVELEYGQATNEMAIATNVASLAQQKTQRRRLTPEQAKLLLSFVNVTNSGFFPLRWPKDRFPLPIGGTARPGLSPHQEVSLIS
jgi:hypothetical protein